MLNKQAEREIGMAECTQFWLEACVMCSRELQMVIAACHYFFNRT